MIAVKPINMDFHQKVVRVVSATALDLRTSSVIQQDSATAWIMWKDAGVIVARKTNTIDKEVAWTALTATI